MSEHLSYCFVGGWGSTDELWQATLAAPELRERTPQAHFLSWIDCLRDWPGSIDTLTSLPGRLLCVGWSLGALLLLRAAAELAETGSAEKLAAMVLVSATPRLTAAPGYDGADPRMLAAMRARIGRNCPAVLEEFALGCAAPDGGQAAARAYLEQTGTFTPEELALGLGALAEIDLRQRLASIQVPCRLLHGSSDWIVPVGSARFLAAQLPHAGLELLHGSGHALPFTHPEEIAHSIAGAAEEFSA